MTEMAADGKKKIVFIGDSLVNGFPFPRSMSFVALLADKLGIEAVNAGANGHSTYEILARFVRDAVGPQPDAAVISAGANDLIFIGGSSAETILENLAKMAETAREAGIRPIILTPPLCWAPMANREWMASVDYMKVNDQLERLGKMLLARAKADDLFEVIDLQSAYSGFAAREGAQNAYTDGVHPTAGGYEFIAGFLAGELEKIL